MTISKIQKTRQYISNHIQQYETICKDCSLCDWHKPIIYRGDRSASIALVGEAPGKEEEKENLPFVGPAGQLLNKIFDAIGLCTEDMFITNVLWCRPRAPEGSGRQNLSPKIKQIKKCWPYTRDLLEILEPKIIIACGLPALKSITGMHNPRMKDYEGRWIDGNSQTKIFVMRHPASILHLSKDSEEQHKVKKQVWQYMQHFRDTYKQYL